MASKKNKNDEVSNEPDMKAKLLESRENLDKSLAQIQNQITEAKSYLKFLEDSANQLRGAIDFANGLEAAMYPQPEESNPVASK